MKYTQNAKISTDIVIHLSVGIPTANTLGAAVCRRRRQQVSFALITQRNVRLSHRIRNAGMSRQVLRRCLLLVFRHLDE